MIDSCDHLTNPFTKYPYGSGTVTMDTGTFRTGTQSMKFAAAGGEIGTAETGAHDMGVGYYAYIDQATYSGLDALLMRLHELDFPNPSVPLVSVVADSSGRFVIHAGDRGTVLWQSSTNMVPLQEWFAVEIVVDNFIEDIYLYLNHSLIGSYTSIGSISGQPVDFYIGNDTSAVAWYLDDLYTGGLLLEPWEVVHRFPNAAGSYSQWTANGASPNYACVNDLSVPDDADSDGEYVSVTLPQVADKIDTYNYADLSSGCVIQQVQVAHRQGNPHLGNGHYFKRGGSEASNLSITDWNFGFSTDLIYRGDVYLTDPIGGAWTVSNFNSTEFGVIREDSPESSTVKIMQFVVEVLCTFVGVSQHSYGYVTRTLAWSEPYTNLIEDGGTNPVVLFTGEQMVEDVE